MKNLTTALLYIGLIVVRFKQNGLFGPLLLNKKSSTFGHYLNISLLEIGRTHTYNLLLELV